MKLQRMIVIGDKKYGSHVDPRVTEHVAVSVRPQLWDKHDDCFEFAYEATHRLYSWTRYTATIENLKYLTVKIEIRSMEQMGKKSLGDWKGFADINLSTAEKKQAKEYADNAAQIWDVAEDMVASGYKITLSYDSRSDVNMCSISCYDENSTNYKHTMVTRARTMWGALAVGVFKHEVVAKGTWTKQTDAEIDF